MAAIIGNGNITFGDSTALTTAGVLSSAANGYVKFPNGLIMQWAKGTSVAIAANSAATVTSTFPLAFTTVYQIVVAGFEVSTTSWPVAATHLVSNTTTTFVTAFRNMNNGTQGNTMQPIYIAFGV
jgi:hypothetical protein